MLGISKFKDFFSLNETNSQVKTVEILSNLHVLTTSTPNLFALSMAGVHFGASATSVPLAKVTQVTLAPIVVKSNWDQTAGARYWDANDRELSFKEVIDSVARQSGVLHFEGGFSYGISEGRVMAFALYGEVLDAFAHLRTHSALLESFGEPSRSFENVAYGDLMGITLHYDDSEKQVDWDSRNNKISIIRLGSPI